MTENTTPPVSRPEAMDGKSLAAALDEAATAALRAPSIYNVQPWKWRIEDGALELHADPDRQLRATDAEGRMLVVSCGVALHHAVTALAALGYRTEIRYLPNPNDADLLARIEPTGHQPPTAEQEHLYQAMLRRRTDRRPFGDEPVPQPSLDELRDRAEDYGVHVHVLHPDQLPEFLVAASTAASVELTDPAYRAELSTWTHRPETTGDGVPTTTTVPESPRRVPLRTFALDGANELEPGDEHDRSTRYALLWGDNDGRRAWIHAGEALSAVLIAATALGLAASPMSDLVEVTASRVALRRMLHWLGHPFVVVRIGVAASAERVPPTPRRQHDDMITTADDSGTDDSAAESSGTDEPGTGRESGG